MLFYNLLLGMVQSGGVFFFFWSYNCRFMLLLLRIFYGSIVYIQKTAQVFFFFNLFHLFICFWLRWVFVAACGLSLVAASGGYSSLRCAGFSLRWLLLLWSAQVLNTQLMSEHYDSLCFRL